MVKKYGNISNCDTGISSSETIDCSTQDCFSGGISSTRESGKEQEIEGRRQNKFILRESENSNEWRSEKVNGRRVRKRTSRGVQTHNSQPKEKLSQRGKEKIVNLFKFKWRSSDGERKKGKQKRTEILTTDNLPDENNVDVIQKPCENSQGNYNGIRNTNSNDASSETSGKEPEGRPVQANSNIMQKKSYNRSNRSVRKYDFSIDGANVEVIRTQKSGMVEKSSTTPKQSTDASRSDLREKSTNTRRKRHVRCKQNTKKPAVANKGNLFVSEEGSSGQIDERSSNKSKTHGSARRKDKLVDETTEIDEPKKSKNGNKRVLNNEVKDTSQTGNKMDKWVANADKKPVGTKEEIAPRSKKTAKSSAFKLFTKSGRGSFIPRQPPSEESRDGERRSTTPRNEFVSKRLDTRRNDIAEVKIRLDACIADLNDIISNLSNIFQQIPTSGGPAGEGAATLENNNQSREGRSRFR